MRRRTLAHLKASLLIACVSSGRVRALPMKVGVDPGPPELPFWSSACTAPRAVCTERPLISALNSADRRYCT